MQKIEHDSLFKPSCCFDSTVGPTGNNVNSATCFFIDKMRDIIQQNYYIIPKW